MSEQKKQDETSGVDQTKVGAEPAVGGDYRASRRRPPKAYQYQKGRSGNPSGRPKKGRSKKAIFEQIMNEPITVVENGKKLKVPKYGAMVRAHLNKAIKGDGRSAKLIMEEAVRVGFGEDQEDGLRVLLPPKIQSTQFDLVFSNIDLEVLSDEEKIELARLGKVIDLGGDFTALCVADFARLKQITDRGRGKDVTRRDLASAQSSS